MSEDEGKVKVQGATLENRLQCLLVHFSLGGRGSDRFIYFRVFSRWSCGNSIVRHFFVMIYWDSMGLFIISTS